MVGSPTSAMSGISPRACSHSSTFTVPLIGGAFLVAGDQQADRAAASARSLGEEVRAAPATKAAIAALHVGRRRGRRACRPAPRRRRDRRVQRSRRRRHHVGVAGEAEMRAAAAAPGEEVVHSGVAGLAKPAAAMKPSGVSAASSTASAPASAGGDARGSGSAPAPAAAGRQVGIRSPRLRLDQSVPQQLVDRGLGAGLLVHALDDHRAVERRARRAVRQRLARQASPAPPRNRPARGP